MIRTKEEMDRHVGESQSLLRLLSRQHNAASLQDATREDLLAFKQEHYHAGRMKLVIVGAPPNPPCLLIAS
eukprot:COSAG01_NODE_2760_length_7120_cov_49.854253_2_plen_71_part_00